MHRFTLYLLAINISAQIHAQQNVAINNTGTLPHASAQVDISSTSKGLLIPRMTSSQRTSISSPATGLLVFDSTTKSFWFHNGTGWTNLAASSTSWLLNGNSGTNPSTNYIGTSDNSDLRFKINNTNAGLLGNNGNAFWGLRSGNNNTTGLSNVAIGIDALNQNTIRRNLVAIGDSSMYNSINGVDNTAIGSKSLFANVSGSSNTAVGSQSLYNNTGSSNTAIGVLTLGFNTSGAGNTALGASSLRVNTIGTNNAATGASALFYNTTGSYNTANGTASLFSNTEGNNNTAVGAAALASNITGYSNVAIGTDALSANTTRSNLVAIGDSALFNNGIGVVSAGEATENVAIGSKALYANRRGFGNTAIGFHAMQNNDGITAIANTAVGYIALMSNTTGGRNTAIGAGSLQNNTTGGFNTSIGDESLLYNTTGGFNTATGQASLFGNTTGLFNSANGFNSLSYNTTGSNNSATGAYSLRYNTTGSGNTAFGYQSLLNNTTGYSNIAIGIDALNMNSIMSHLVAIGDSALFNFTLGEDNTAIGSKALIGSVSGDFLTAIGSNASVTGSINATAIGAYSVADCNNCMVLGASGVKVGIGINSPTAKLSISANGIELSGAAASAAFRSNAGSLGISTGNYLQLGNFGFQTGSNHGSLGIRAYRNELFGGWEKNALLLSYDVDNTFNAPGTYAYLAFGGNGGIGIGTTTPQRLFSVAGSMSIDQNNSSDGSLSSGFTFGGGGGEGIVSKKTAGGNQYGLDFYSNFLTRMSITNGGNVGIGTSSPGSLLEVNGFAAKPGGGSWLASSDARLKQSIQPYTDGLSSLLKINPVKFHYNENSGYDTKAEYVGVIAQELKAVAPYMVNNFQKNGETYLNVDNSAMIYMLINSVKEQQQIINDQQKQIDELKKLVEKLMIK